MLFVCVCNNTHMWGNSDVCLIISSGASLFQIHLHLPLFATDQKWDGKTFWFLLLPPQWSIKRLITGRRKNNNKEAQVLETIGLNPKSTKAVISNYGVIYIFLLACFLSVLLHFFFSLEIFKKEMSRAYLRIKNDNGT